MKEIKKVKAWICSDNKTFECEHDALQHQIEIDFSETLEVNAIIGSLAGSYALEDDVKDWILDHADLVSRYIELHPPKR